jgi:hypothetical protein
MISSLNLSYLYRTKPDKQEIVQKNVSFHANYSVTESGMCGKEKCEC